MEPLNSLLHGLSTDPVKTALQAIVAALTIAGVIWKVLPPIWRLLFRRQVLYAAQIAELRQPPQGGFRPVLDQYLPILSFPSFSDDSVGRPHWPPKANSESDGLFNVMQACLSGAALAEAKELEETIPEGLVLFGPKSPELSLVQTYARLRWYLVEKCKGDYAKFSTDVGDACCAALRSVDTESKRLLDEMPTRILVLRIKNRSGKDATDLKLEITVGGTIFDVTVNERNSLEVLEVSLNRVFVKQATVLPGYVVEVRIWYRWISVLFGCPTGQQSESFKGLEGIRIEYLGISNGKVYRSRGLLGDLHAWRSIYVDVSS
jgi:hypothetical protein